MSDAMLLQPFKWFFSADAVLSDEGDDAPVLAWSLDELDRLFDLNSVRSAWGMC